MHWMLLKEHVRQWDVSEKWRFLYGLKPKLKKKGFDLPDRKQFSLKAQLRIGYAKLNDHVPEIGISETSMLAVGR